MFWMQKIIIFILCVFKVLQRIIVIQVHAKLHKNVFITLKHKKVVEKFVKDLFYGGKNSHFLKEPMLW